MCSANSAPPGDVNTNALVLPAILIALGEDARSIAMPSIVNSIAPPAVARCRARMPLPAASFAARPAASLTVAALLPAKLIALEAGVRRIAVGE